MRIYCVGPYSHNQRHFKSGRRNGTPISLICFIVAMKYVICTIILAVLKESHPLNPEILKYDQFMKDFETTGRRIKQETADQNMDESLVVKHEKIRSASKDVTYPTKWPYPGKLKKTDWSEELEKRPSNQNTTAHREIDAIFTEFLEILSRDDEAKRNQLTLHYEWFPMEASSCFDRVRDLITKLCVEWRWNPYVQKFGYIVVNMCNADWLKMSDIEDCITDTCTGKRVKAQNLQR